MEKKGQLQCRGSHLNEAMHYWVNDLTVENKTWAKSSLKGAHKDDLLQSGNRQVRRQKQSHKGNRSSGEQQVSKTCLFH